MLTDFLQRLRALVLRGRVERELDDELRDHLARETEARARAGSANPRRDALLALGNVERVKDDVREARGVLALEETVADVRFAFRALRRNAGFTATVVAVLGLGLGAATAVFAVVDGVLIRRLPYPDPDRLVRVYEQNSPTNRWTLSIVDAQAIASRQRTLAAFGTAQSGSASLAGAGAARRIPVGRVTAGFFATLGVPAVRGRLLEPADDVPGAPPVVVASYALASTMPAGVDGAVGASLTLDGVARTVVGVLEPGRDELAGIRAQAWPSLQLPVPLRRAPFGYRGYARLARGVSIDAAARDLAGISASIFPIWSASFADSAARLTPVPLRDAVIGSADRQVWLFAGAVGLVLLLAVANVATLALVRASGREHEMALRGVLGAGRRRLARLVVVECLVLTSLATVVGLALAVLGLQAVAFVAPNLPRMAEVALAPRTIAFAAAAALASGMLIALASLSAGAFGTRTAGDTLRGSPGRSGAGRPAHAVRSALVIAEFALALPLLVGAGLLLNSFVRLERVDAGFNPDSAYALQISLPAGRYPDTRAIQAFWRLAEPRVAETSGVRAAGLGALLPPDEYGDVNNFDLVDKPVPVGTSQPVAPWSPVTNGYFRTIGIRLLEGRLFSPGDTAGAPPVVVASKSWVDRYYRGESAVGKQLREGGCLRCPLTTVIGVVSDVHYLGLASGGDALYPALAQQQGGSMYIVVRSALGPSATFRALHETIASLDPDIAPVDIVVRDRMRAALGDPRRWATTVGAFATVGVVLAAIGIFGLMSFVVRQRRRELGVRLALGAEPASLTRLVVRRGMGYALVGSAVGVALSFLESRWLGSLLFGVSAADPVTLALAAVALLAVAGIACWLPGAQAARIRPSDVLSAE